MRHAPREPNQGPTADENESAALRDAIHDILSVEGGPGFRLIDRPDLPHDLPYGVRSVFILSTNPSLDLPVSIEVAIRAMRIRLHGIPFAVERVSKEQPGDWINRGCGVVEQLVLSRDLALQQVRFFRWTCQWRLWGRSEAAAVDAADDEGWTLIRERVESAGDTLTAFGAIIPIIPLFEQTGDEIYRHWSASGP